MTSDILGMFIVFTSVAAFAYITETRSSQLGGAGRRL
jgi:hypothetical protein